MDGGQGPLLCHPQSQEGSLPLPGPSWAQMAEAEAGPWGLQAGRGLGGRALLTPRLPGREVEDVYGGGGSQEAGDKEALAGAASGTGQETFSEKLDMALRSLERGQWRGEWGLCVHCPLPEPWAAPPWEHVAPGLHSTTWSLPETRPPSGRIWDVWLRHKALGTPEALGSKIAGLEMGFQGCALGCLRGWWAGRGHGAGAGLWGAGGPGESSPWGAIWNQAGAPRPVRPFGKN